MGRGGPRVALWLPGRRGSHARVLPVLRGRLQAAFKVGLSAHGGRGSRPVRLRGNAAEECQPFLKGLGENARCVSERGPPS